MAKTAQNTSKLRFDSSGLMRVLGGLSNQNTGLGTARDKAATVQVESTTALTDEECLSLCRNSGILNTIVECYPLDAAKSWATITMAEENSIFDADGLWKYINLKDRIETTINDDCRSLKDYFIKVSVLARKYGDCYLLLGVADGMEPDQPIYWEGIESFVGVKICRNVVIENGYYKINNVYWHPDRVIRFCGLKLYDDNGDLLPQSDSVLQNVFTAYSRWESGNTASASMLLDYNFLLIGIKGLGQSLRNDVVNQTQIGAQSLLSRLLTVDMNKSIARSVAHDLDNEKLEMMSRNYGGAKDIIESLKEALSASTNIPRWRMFNEMAGGGLSNNVNTVHLAKADWNDRLNGYKEAVWRSPLEYLLKIAMSAKDSPTKGAVVDAAVTFPTGGYISDLEKVQIEKSAAERSKILVDAGIISVQEVRNCYANNEFTTNITLIQEEAPEPEPEPEPERDKVKPEANESEDGGDGGDLPDGSRGGGEDVATPRRQKTKD